MEGWDPSIDGRDTYLMGLTEADRCQGEGASFVNAASPPGFPFDHCIGSDGKICGQLYTQNAINTIMGASPSPPFLYNENPRMNTNCEIATCIPGNNHCSGNEANRHCEDGQCVSCLQDSDCEGEDSLCKEINGVKFCINKDLYRGDLDEIGTYVCSSVPFRKKYDTETGLAKCGVADTIDESCCTEHFIGGEAYQNIVMGLGIASLVIAILLAINKGTGALRKGDSWVRSLSLIASFILFSAFCGSVYYFGLE